MFNNSNTQNKINFKKEETENEGADEEFEPEMTVGPIISLERIENHDDGQLNHTIEFEKPGKIYCWARESWINHGKANVQISTDQATNSSTLVARDPVTKKLRLCGGVHKGSDITKKSKSAVSLKHKDFAGDNRDGGKGILFSIKFDSAEDRDNFITIYERRANATATTTSNEKIKGVAKNATENKKPVLNFATPSSSPGQGKEKSKNKFSLKIPKKTDAPSEEKLEWVSSFKTKGESIWTTLCDFYTFENNKWSEGNICRISICHKDSKFWVEICNEQKPDKILHAFAFFSNTLIKVKDNTTLWSCVDYENNGAEVTLCATFKDHDQAEHCQAIFETIKNQGVTLSKVKEVVSGVKDEEVNITDVINPSIPKIEKPKPIASDPPAKKKEEKFKLSFGGGKKTEENKKTGNAFLNFGGFKGFGGNNKKDDGKKNTFGDIFNKDNNNKLSFGSSTFSTSSPSKTNYNPFGGSKNENTKKEAISVETNNTTTNDEDEDNGLEYTLEPLVKLEKIDHKTGEEDDEIIFQKHGKVYIYVSAEKDLKGKAQWKERGMGDIFIKKNKAGKYRVIQRQDITQKLRIHHYCYGEMNEFKTPSRMTWSGIDSCDGLEETNPETGKEGAGTWIFAAKFKSAEDATEFQAAFARGAEGNKEN